MDKKELKELLDAIKEELTASAQKMSEAKSSVPYGGASPSNHKYYKAVSLKKALAAVDNAEKKYLSQKESQKDTDKEQLQAWLKEQIHDLTYGTMTATVEPSGYDDRLSPSTILSAFHSYQESKKEMSFSDYLLDFTYNIFDDARDYEEYYLLEEIEKRLRNSPSAIQSAYADVTEDLSAWETLALGGYEGTNIDMRAFLDTDYKVNLMFATKEERNLDYGAITGQFPYDIADSNLTDDKSRYEQYANNALTYLIHQQGYAVQDIYKEFYSEITDTESLFVETTAEELQDAYNMTELTALVTLKGHTLLDVLDKVAKGENYLRLAKDTTIGLFNEWDGSGSAFGITLEKDAVLPCSMITNVQMEGAEKQINHGWTVDSVYGLVGSMWKDAGEIVEDSAEIVENTGEIVTEKAEDMYEAFKDCCKEVQREEIELG